MNLLKNKKILISLFILVIASVYSYNLFSPDENLHGISPALAAKFEILSKQGNSSCSGAFKASIAGMSDTAHIQGSCCSPMDPHRYGEQVEGLKKYKDILEIPLTRMT